MTIGDKIKYCRAHTGISQAKLAELSGISLVSIKRYETNKALPLPPQIQRLADAFGVNVGVFEEPVSGWNISLETYGDLIKLVMILRRNHIITINGDRGKDGILISDTVTFSLAPTVGKYFQAVDLNCLSEDIQLTLNRKMILDSLLKWESLYTKYEELSTTYKDDEGANAALKSVADDLDIIELEMQFNSILLESADGHITVKVNRDFGNEAELAKAREKAIAKELKSQKKKKPS